MTDTTDLVKRLRDPAMSAHESQSYVVWQLDDDALLEQAADAIEQLQRELEEARKDAEKWRNAVAEAEKCGAVTICSSAYAAQAMKAARQQSS